MRDSQKMPIDILARYVGRPITRVRRVLYVYRDVMDASEGPLELSFHSGDILYLDASGDGEHLSLSSQAWEDAFSPPLSEVNENFVQTCGKWTAFELKNTDPLGVMIGLTIERVEEVVGIFGSPTGLVLFFRSFSVVIEVVADDLRVQGVSRPDKEVGPLHPPDSPV